MADNHTRLPVPRALAETSLNLVRQNPMAPPSEMAGKRKLPQPTSLQPASKAAKANAMAKSLQSLAGRVHGGSGIARPASAASARHGPSRSVDVAASGKGYGARPATRSQTSRARPGTSMDTVSSSKGGPPSDVTLSSMHRFSSCSQSSSVFSGQSRTRNVSDDSIVSSLIKGFADLHVTPRAGSRAHKGVGSRSQSSNDKTMFHGKFCSKTKTPKKRRTKEPVTPACYLTKESNTRVPAAFDVESRMSDMTTMIKKMTDGVGSALEERNGYAAALEMHMARISELEASRSQLEESNTFLQRQLDATRSAVSKATIEADEARRLYLDEIDGTRRRHRDELDELKRSHRDEVDGMRRETQRNQESVEAAAKEQAEGLEKRHQTEMDDVRRQLTLELEEERQERRRHQRELEDQVRNAQLTVENRHEHHLKELQSRELRVEQVSDQLRREQDVSDDLRRQLVRSEGQTTELENATRNLRAQVEFLKSDSKSQSQAFADLEQQTQDALTQTETYKTQLRKEETMRRKLLNQIQDLKGNIRVFCRVRPPLTGEMGACAQIAFPDADVEAKAVEVVGPEEKSSLGKVTTKNHAFSFDRSFGPASENGEIFTELSELVAAVCGGSFNTCIFSYGQTGSGKTYTMASPDGMIARAVTQIFDTAAELVERGWRYTVTGSFVEVYNENINDLLGRPEDFDRKRHEIRHNPHTLTTEITDVAEVELASAAQFDGVLERALRNRSIAATKANERSSRSHSVCILRLAGENASTGESCRSTLNLVDLAGSERLAHSQATGSRLRETQNINKSLSCLADVIAALGDAREGTHIPYRNSKLTYLLQNSLGGNSKTLMFVMISPLQEHLGETLSSLNFATKVNNTRIVRKQKR